MQLPRPTHLLVLAMAIAAAAPASASAAEPPVSEQIIVRYRAGTDAADRADTRADAETVHEEAMRLANTEVVAVAEGTRSEALAELNADPDVLSAEPNLEVRPLTSDYYWSLLWGLYNGGTGGMRIDSDVDAEQAWTATEGSGVTVAVVDTGVQANHPDLVGRVVAGYDFVNADSDPADGHGHGTHVAGTIAANKGNGLGVAGLAPQAQILPLKALPDAGSGTTADVIEAFDYAGDYGAEVVNASLGGDGFVTPLMQQAFTDHPATVYVISAGNDGRNNDLVPTTPCVSTASNVLCVGATDATDARASFSNYGASTVDIFAPGVDIASTYKGSQYIYMDGTSMAAPHAAAAAALVVADDPSLTGAQVAQRLKDTVDPVAALAGKSVTGGRLNAARAVGATVDAPSQPVVNGAAGGVNAATITMTSRESDVSTYLVYENGNLVKTSSSATIPVTGLAAGSHTFTLVAQNTSSQTSPASAPVTVTATDPPPVTPTPPVTPSPPAERPGTATAPTPAPSPVSDVRLVTRRGRTSLMFRVNQSARITVTLLRLQGGSYRRTASKTVRMAAGLQSLPVTSRLLGMRVPRGRWQVTVGTAAHTATVAFTRR